MSTLKVDTIVSNQGTSGVTTFSGDVDVEGSLNVGGNQLLDSGTIFSGDVSGTYNSISVTNDSHTHTFDNLTGKDAGTGNYSTSGDIESGRGSGGVALTINDGYGNANVTFNHKSGTPEQDGKAARITANTDASAGSAELTFQLGNATSGVAGALTNILQLSSGTSTFYEPITFNSLVNIRGNMDLADNDILRFGSGDDCELFCNGTHMYMDLNNGIGNFYIRDGTNTRFTFADDGRLITTSDITTQGDFYCPNYNTAADNTANVRMASGSGKLSRISSTRKIKKDIETVSDFTAYNFLNNANPVEYTSLIADDDQRRLFGFIAEEMDEVDPLLTEYEEDGSTPISVKYGSIPIILTKIIQLQEERIKTLETQVQQLLGQ